MGGSTHRDAAGVEDAVLAEPSVATAVRSACMLATSAVLPCGGSFVPTAHSIWHVLEGQVPGAMLHVLGCRFTPSAHPFGGALMAACVKDAHVELLRWYGSAAHVAAIAEMASARSSRHRAL